MPAQLGLSTYQWNNNIKSVLLLLAFPFLLLALLGGILYIMGLTYGSSYAAGSPDLFQSFNLRPIHGTDPLGFAEAGLYAYWPIVLGVAVIWVIIGYLCNDAMIHSATGAEPVTRQQAPELYNILENLCISRGMKTPALYIIDTDELNAFASGTDEKTYSINVTRGLLAKLDAKEMEAVLAHELTHIINRDCRLLIVTVVLVGMISFVAQLMWRGMRFASYSRDRRGGGAIFLMFVAGIMLMIGYFFALILRFAISRKREYLADAGSVELTKNPEALISALRKISVDPDVPHVPPEVKQMFIENPPSAMDFFGLLATHPPIDDRIKVLQELGGLPQPGHSIVPRSE